MSSKRTPALVAGLEMWSPDLALLLSGVDVAQTRRRWYERVA